MAVTTCTSASGASTLVHLVTLLHLLASTAYANPPLIHYSHNMRILKIPVHTEPGSIVYRIKASDADNENIAFGVLEDYGQALLRFDKANHHEANVVLLLPLQENDEFNLTIYATDNNESTYIESRLIATTVPAVQITLTPLVLQQNPVYVNENETLNRSIATVRAYDREDSKLPVTFELLESTSLFDFHYVFGPRGMSTAELVLIDKLDYERQNLYILTLLAINAQTNEEVDTRNVHSVKLSIVVQDVQDSPPVFTNLPQLVSIDVEHHQMSDIIYSVSAQDGDTGDTVNQRNVTFSVLEPNKEIFRITNNGIVYLTKSPEEIGNIFGEHKPAKVDIQANEVVLNDEMSENEDTSSVSQLLVRFVSGNRSPQFKTDHLVGRIDEHSAPHSAVVWQEGDLAQVLDLDQGLNGTIELELIDPDGTFTIEPSVAYRQAQFTLLVNNSAMLDFEARRNLSVMIIAKDKSEEAVLSSNVTCTIFIDDINDNYPQFSQPVYESAIYENAPEGSSVAQISATDKDSGDYGQVRFTGLKGIFAKSLSIDAINGIVKLTDNSELDRELVAEYVVTVEARDNLGKGNLNTTELHIRVLDVNDNPPIFLQQSYLALLNSEMTNFVQPLQMTAIDIDEMNNSNSVVNYEILQGNYEGLFSIDQHSGKVTVRESASEKRLAPSDGSKITLTVRAYDLGIPQLSSTTQIFIYTMNRPNTIKAHFISKRRISPLAGNESLEKVLSEITGGNVTISEAKLEKVSQPNSIAASVQYRNESIMDLDVMAKALDRLMVRDGSHFDPDRHMERETEIIPTKGNTDQSTSNRQVHNHNDEGKRDQSGSNSHATTTNNNSNSSKEVITSRLFHTTQFGNLDLLLWIMIFLILFLLIILIYLLCLLCKDKRNNKKIITQTEVPKSTPVLSSGKAVVRAKRRKTRPVRNANKIVDVSKKVDSIITVALEDEQAHRDKSFDVEEEKKYGTKTTDNMVTYYEYKRLRYPKQSEVKTTNVLTLERMDPTVNNSPNIDHDQPNEGTPGQVGFLNVPMIPTNEAESSRATIPKPVSFSVMQAQQDSSVRIDGGAYPVHNLFEGANIDMAGENMRAGSYRNLQKKSIFSITYDRINSRENISAGSENVN